MARIYGGDLARTMYAESVLDVHKRELHRKDVKIRQMRAEIKRLQLQIDELKETNESLELELEMNDELIRSLLEEDGDFLWED